MIASKNYIQKCIENENTFPKKKYSQNFLVNEDIALNIIKCLNFNKDDTCIEIGPGLGALTEIILNQGVTLHAYEIDEKMCEHLKKTFSYSDSFHLHEGDFLKADLSNLKSNSIYCVSNIPYSITTPVIEKIILELHFLKKFVFMTQKEVSERLFAKIKTKEYAPLSIFLEYVGVLKKEFIVSKNNFFPIPHVDSCVFSLVLNENRDSNFDYAFYKFLKDCFKMRRKTLLNNLISTYSKDKIINMLEKLKMEISIRPEEIDLKNYLEMFKLIRNEQ